MGIYNKYQPQDAPPARLTGFLVRGMFRGLALLPLPVSHRLGSMLGSIISRFPSRMMRITRINIRRCLPELSAAAQKKLLRESTIETAKAVMESGAVWCWPVERLLARVTTVHNWGLVENAMQQGKGLVIAVPHLGAWEVVGLYVSSRIPMTALYRPPRQPELDALIRAGRTRAGARVAPTSTAGIRDLYRALRAGESLAILPDQEPDEAGIFAPFFGIQAYSMTLLPRLARKAGAPVILIHCERLPGGQGFALHCTALDEDVQEGSLEDAVTTVNRGVEKLARANPRQYQWAYKRFHKRPAGEARFYTRAAAKEPL